MDPRGKNKGRPPCSPHSSSSGGCAPSLLHTSLPALLFLLICGQSLRLAVHPRRERAAAGRPTALELVLAQSRGSVITLEGRKQREPERKQGPQRQRTHAHCSSASLHLPPEEVQAGISAKGVSGESEHARLGSHPCRNRTAGATLVFLSPAVWGLRCSSRYFPGPDISEWPPSGWRCHSPSCPCVWESTAGAGPAVSSCILREGGPELLGL